MSYRTISSLIFFIILIFSFLWLNSNINDYSKQLKNYIRKEYQTNYYKELDFDRNSFTLNLKDQIKIKNIFEKKDISSYFSKYKIKDNKIVHYGELSDKGRNVYNTFYTSQNSVLFERKKVNFLFEGEFGKLSSTINYYYDQLDESIGSRAIVSNKDIDGEYPTISNRSDIRDKKLQIISLVRIIKVKNNQFLLMSAQYKFPTWKIIKPVKHSNSGGILSGAENGKHKYYKSIRAVKPITSPDLKINKNNFGLPDKFNLDDYMDTPTSPFSKEINTFNKNNTKIIDDKNLEIVHDIVNLHYDYNHLIRQDIWDGEKLIETRWLEYEWTDLDKDLFKFDKKSTLYKKNNK